MSAAEIPSGGVPASAIHNRSAHAKPPVTPRRGEPSDRFYKNPKFFVRIYYKQRRTSGGGGRKTRSPFRPDAIRAGLGTGIVPDPAQ
jgi:hypothetical protein